MLLDKNLLLRGFLAVIVFWGLSALSLPGGPYAQDLDFLDQHTTYLCPTDASHQHSSTFAETRSAHLNAGIDIRTFGREGFRGFATRGGVVHRGATGPYGYGNVVYLKHDDGAYSVYAHLNRFEPGLQQFVDSLRFINYSFDLNVELEEHQISYRQASLIPFTRSTVNPSPHLHF